MTLLEIILLFGSFLIFILALYWAHQAFNAREIIERRKSQLDEVRRDLKNSRALWEKAIKEIEKLTEAKTQPNNSLELTEFLADFKSHGYSFVRVDPNSVMYRSPRE